jgi:hypothetical protein
MASLGGRLPERTLHGPGPEANSRTNSATTIGRSSSADVPAHHRLTKAPFSQLISPMTSTTRSGV